MEPAERLSCVLLADRHHGLSDAVRGLLETAFGSVVMVADKVSLLEAAARLQPDVAVVDLSLGKESSLGWLDEVRRVCPSLKLIALSAHDEPSVRQAALNAGADAFILKRSLSTDLLPAVDQLRPACEGDPSRPTAKGTGRQREEPRGP